MSAFLVSKEHIDFLVSAAVLADKWDKPFQWYVSSAWRSFRYEGAEWVGAMLWAENRRSMEYRYGKDVFEPGEIPPYTFSPIGFRPRASEVFSAIECLAYQSCETPEWKHSEAYAFLEALKSAWIRRLPGYRKAPWGWDAEKIAARRNRTEGGRT